MQIARGYRRREFRHCAVRPAVVPHVSDGISIFLRSRRNAHVRIHRRIALIESTLIDTARRAGGLPVITRGKQLTKIG